MQEIQILSGNEALKKIKDLINHKVCMFYIQSNGKADSFPMFVSQVDEEGNIWAMSKEESKHLHVTDTTYLMYIDKDNRHYVSLTGQAEVVKDKKKIDELWSPMANVWFPKSKDEPSLTLIKMKPGEGQYWDTKNEKLLSLLKIAMSASVVKPLEECISDS